MTQAHDFIEAEERSENRDLTTCQSREESPVPQPQPAQRNWQKCFVVICMIYSNFWIASSMSLQAPFFPHEAEIKGATATQYGLVFGIYEFVIILMSPICGRLIPRVSPKCLSTVGIIITGIACCAFGVLDKVPAGKIFISLAFIIRIIEGMGAAAILTASFTIVATCFPETIGTSFSMLETPFGVGMIVGPTIGGALYEVGGFFLPFIINGGFLLIGGLLLGILLPSCAEAERQGASRNLLKFLLDGGIFSFTFSIISSFALLGFNAATLEPHVRMFNLKPVVLGVIFVISGAVYAMTTPIWGRLIDRGISPLAITAFGYILSIIGMLFIGPITFINLKPTLGLIIASLVISGLGVAAKLTSSFSGTVQNTIDRGLTVDLAMYGMISAFFTTACSIGSFIGPSVGGFLLDRVGYRMGSFMIVLSETFFLVLLILHALHRLLKKRRNRKEMSEREPLLTPQSTRRGYMELVDQDET